MQSPPVSVVVAFLVALRGFFLLKENFFAGWARVRSAAMSLRSPSTTCNGATVSMHHLRASIGNAHRLGLLKIECGEHCSAARDQLLQLSNLSLQQSIASISTSIVGAVLHLFQSLSCACTHRHAMSEEELWWAKGWMRTGHDVPKRLGEAFFHLSCMGLSL